MKIEKFNKYEGKKRFLSYWYQIKEVLDLSPSSVLKIGIGTKLVSSYLKNYGIKVKTTDIDKEKEPDYLLDVRKLTEEFGGNEFDVVLCAEVLEHIPYGDFKKALKEISSVGEEAVITLPHRALNFRLTIDSNFPRVLKTLGFKLPVPEKDDLGPHEWEIANKHSLEEVKNDMEKFFKIKNTYCIPENLWHRVFVLV